MMGESLVRWPPKKSVQKPKEVGIDLSHDGDERRRISVWIERGFFWVFFVDGLAKEIGGRKVQAVGMG
jgi:hypothetical protein